MNTINLHDTTSFADFEPVADAPVVDAVESTPAADGCVTPEPVAEPKVIDHAEPAYADASVDLGDAACDEQVSLPVIDADLPVIEIPIKLFDIVDIIRQITNSLSKFLSSFLAITIRTPLFRPDAQLMERLTRTQEDVRKDDAQKIEFRRKLVALEPVEVMTTQTRTTRMVGDELVTEVITTEHQTRSLVSGEGRVVGSIESMQTREAESKR